MSNTSIKFTWDDKDMQRNLKRINASLKISLPDAVDQFGDAVISAVRFFTPKQTGETRASFGKYDPGQIDTGDAAAHRRARDAAIYKLVTKGEETTLTIGTSHQRFFWLNYGTRKMAGRHMAEKGQALARSAFKPLVQRAIDASVKGLRTGPSGQNRWHNLKAPTYVPRGARIGGGLGRRVRITKA